MRITLAVIVSGRSGFPVFESGIASTLGELGDAMVIIGGSQGVETNVQMLNQRS